MIAIFGASTKGQQALMALKGQADVFIDNSPAKWETRYCDLPVLSLEQLIRLSPRAEIIIASQYQIEIICQLLEAGVRVFSLFEPPYREQDFESKMIYQYDFSSIFEERHDSAALVVHNYSGSNTLALSKSGELKKKGIKSTECYSFSPNQDYINALFSCRVVVSTHEKHVPPQAKSLQLWHGIPLKGLNLMSAAQTAESRQNVRQNWLRNDFVASYSTLYRTLMNACYGIPAERYVHTGMPRNDLLFQEGAVSRLREVLPKSTPKAERYLFYIPTFRKTRFGQVNGNPDLELFGFDNFDFERLQLFLEQHDYVLVIKPHPYHEADLMIQLNNANSLDRITTINDSNLLGIGYDFYQLLAAADILITDYSSVYFDFLLLQKPIIFAATDIDEYRQSRGFLLEPYEFWAPGPKVKDQCELELAIISFEQHSQYWHEQRELICNMMHMYRDDRSSFRVATLIEQMMNNQ